MRGLRLGEGWGSEGVRVGSNGRGERPHNGPFRRTTRERVRRALTTRVVLREKDGIYISRVYVRVYIYLGPLLSTLHNRSLGRFSGAPRSPLF